MLQIRGRSGHKGLWIIGLETLDLSTVLLTLPVQIAEDSYPQGE